MAHVNSSQNLFNVNLKEHTLNLHIHMGFIICNVGRSFIYVLQCLPICMYIWIIKITPTPTLSLTKFEQSKFQPPLRG